MSTLGTALKATGVALLASSAVAAGGIGYGGYKLATSVSSTLDTVNQEVKSGDVKENVTKLLDKCGLSFENIGKKIDKLDERTINKFMSSLAELMSAVANNDGKKSSWLVSFIKGIINI